MVVYIYNAMFSSQFVIHIFSESHELTSRHADRGNYQMKYKDSQHTELSLKRLPINYTLSHAHAATYSLELYGLTLLTSQPIEQGGYLW